jgi:hypothetical protein
MRSGNNRTGRTIPKTLGSGKPGENFTGIGIANRAGDATRTAVRIPRHRIHHEKPMAANPHAQIANKTAGIGLAAAEIGGESGAEIAGLVNGRATCCITAGQRSGVSGKAARHAS